MTIFVCGDKRHSYLIGLTGAAVVVKTQILGVHTTTLPPVCLATARG